MNELIKEYMNAYSVELKELYATLRELIYSSISQKQEIEEKLWAKLPSYYVGNFFVRLIPFKDHINIEASAIASHREKCTGYKITPKGMLQIYIGDIIPADILKQLFAETLGRFKIGN